MEDIKINLQKLRRFQGEMIRFYKEKGRKFPWREDAENPWMILLAELLLRKTTAEQVEKVYLVLREYAPCMIATMKLQILSDMLKPLGIHRERARLIKQIAIRICEQNKVPEDKKELLKLPGVGEYTANAVLCVSYGVPLPMMDRNMIRVLSRVFGIKSKKPRPHTDRYLWKFAEKLVPSNNCRDFNWGVLDFASLICRARKPLCVKCSLKDICEYYRISKKGDNKFK